MAENQSIQRWFGGAVCLILIVVIRMFGSQLILTSWTRTIYVQHYDIQNTSMDPVKILYWTTFYGDKNWYGIGSAPFRNCKYSSCTATADTQELNNSDVILVHMRNIKGIEYLPKWRHPEQAWVMYMRESPVHALIPYQPFNHVFNASMTYKNASDIYLPTIQFRRRDLTPPRSSVNYAAGKSRLVAWFASNCHTQSKREKYVAQLQRYINIDIYGNCGALKCPKQQGKSRVNFCDRQLKTNYKFYLSFENSLCVEYFTEKVGKVYHLNVVPVVLGGASYTRHLPPKSYINVKDFASPKHLAEHLKHLDKNDTMYNEYFAWKDSYEIVSLEPQCKLCEFAHRHKGKHSTLNRLDLFWSRDLDCVGPREFYKGIAK